MANALNPAFPYLWAAAAQELFDNKLVSKEVTNFSSESDYKYGTRIYKPYPGKFVGATYNVNPATLIPISDATMNEDFLEIDKTWSDSFYIDDLEQEKSKYPLDMVFGKRLMTAMREKIDADILSSFVTAPAGTADEPVFDNGDLSGGASDGNAIVATDTNVEDILLGAERKLASYNAFNDEGEFILVATPSFLEKIKKRAARTGFNTQDKMITNGYFTTFLGFKVYQSNLLDKTTDGRSHIYIGRRGMIDMIMPISPVMEQERKQGKMGNTYKGLCYWGKKIFTQNRTQFLDLHIA